MKRTAEEFESRVTEIIDCCMREILNITRHHANMIDLEFPDTTPEEMEILKKVVEIKKAEYVAIRKGEAGA